MAEKNTIEVDADMLRAVLYGNSGVLSRIDFAKRAGLYSQFEGHRNIRRVAGYPEKLLFRDYLEAYNRQDVAARVIETYPDHTWNEMPEVYEKESSTDTQFEKDWKVLAKTKGLVSYLRSFDTLSGIGRFGVLVMGVDDGRKLNTPFIPNRRSHKLAYMRPYMEGEVRITQWETDIASERYLLPVMYEITPLQDTANIPLLKKTFEVHYTRVIHFADNAVNSFVYGVPRLQRVFDRLIDILKVVAGSGEMFWRGAYQGFSFEADSDAQMTPKDEKDMREDIQKYFMGLDRAMLLRGVTARQLNPTIASPKDHLEVQLTVISIASRIPKRILAGSEVGKLASIQDAETWAQQIAIRRQNIAEPFILRPFVDFCIRGRIVASPAVPDDYNIAWKSLSIPTDKEASESAVNFTNALMTFATSGLYAVVTFKDYLVNVWRYTVEEAEQLASGFDEAKFRKLQQELQIKKAPNKPVSSAGGGPDT
jgi:hypothetical protein